eukprot:scaffold185599_cov19-Tisochrysis_lutea.AAC.3
MQSALAALYAQHVTTLKRTLAESKAGAGAGHEEGSQPQPSSTTTGAFLCGCGWVWLRVWAQLAQACREQGRGLCWEGSTQPISAAIHHLWCA